MMLIIKNTVLTKLLYIAFVFVNGVSEIYSADSNASSSSTALVHRQPTSIIPYGQTPTDIGPYDPILAQGIRISFPPMPFQIGFEFQEISSLCPWAKDLKGIDKKKLFSFHLGRDPKPLWHVEIDDTDIEFVTPPFKPHEKNKLNLAISTIQVAIKVLQRELNTKSKITFDQWTREILFELNLTDSEISQTQTYTDIAQREIIKPKPINFPHVDPEKITKTELVVREEVSYWKPIFAPQVTIQHPLEDTIPLYFSLFGFKSPYMISFVSNLPFLDFYQSKLQFADQNIMNKFIQMFRQKIHGLIFLHALTLSAMTPDVREELSSAQTDQIQLQETQYAWQNFRQVDPKVRLTLMSRRPFSDMYANLKQVNYAEHFIKVMSLNPEFTTFYKVPNHFRYTNYAEQFFNTKGAPLSGLWEFIQPLFEQKFLQNNYLVLQELL
ncbi:MAG TPA: hypothetical protein VNJ29_03300, partial [Candidatus Nitrosotenuis sp.]|nr:hypothetical protein [Candidatus Nitrosotenuis sp.]